MVNGHTVTVMRSAIDATTALQNAAGITAAVSILFEGSVLYPYVGYTARCSVPTVIGRKHIAVDCLVDGINGLGATADPYSTEQLLVPQAIRLQTKITNDHAQQTAMRTVTHRLAKRLRMIAPFDVQLECSGTVYKRFWIMRIGESRIMVDSVTGNMHPLRASAAS